MIKMMLIIICIILSFPSYLICVNFLLSFSFHSLTLFFLFFFPILLPFPFPFPFRLPLPPCLLIIHAARRSDVTPMILILQPINLCKIHLAVTLSRGLTFYNNNSNYGSLLLLIIIIIIFISCRSWSYRVHLLHNITLCRLIIINGVLKGGRYGHWVPRFGVAVCFCLLVVVSVFCC